MNFLCALILTCIGQSIETSTVVVIAHRGASAYLPEHTLESKVAAFVLGSDFIEQDIVLSKDNVPIVLHDIYLDTVTDVAAKFGMTRARNDSRFYVIDFTYDEIRTLNVTERFRISPNQTMEPVYKKRFPLWRSSFKINALSDELELIVSMQKSMQMSVCCNRTVGFYTEIKDPYFHEVNNKANISKIVLDVFANYGFTKSTDPVIIQCFDPFELQKIRNVYKSSLKLVQLLAAPNELTKTTHIDFDYWNSLDGLRNIAKFANGIGPEKDQLIVLDNKQKFSRPAEMVENARQLNLFIHPYTFRADSLPFYVDSFDELLDIFINRVKVDGIFTDFPDLVVNYMHKNTACASVASIYTLLCLVLVLALK